MYRIGLLLLISLPLSLSFHSTLCCCGCETPCPIQHRPECGAEPSTSCSDVFKYNKSESIVACKAIIGVWIANGFPVDEAIEGSNGRRHVLMEMRSGKEISLVTLESKIEAGEKKPDQAITSFSIDSSATRLIDRPLPTLISSPSISMPSSNNQVSLFAEELARQQQQQQQQSGSAGVLGYNWRLGADQQWKLAPVTEEDAQAAAIARNQPIIQNQPMMQPNPMNPMMPAMPSPMLSPQSPMGPLPMSVGRPMGTGPMGGGMMQPPEPSFPAVAWRRFNQVLDGFSTGFSSLADKVFKIM